MRYRAFVSYDHRNRAFAKRLQRQLEGYVLPKVLRAIGPGVQRQVRPLKPIFRDEDELVPGENLPARIRAGLEQSQFLVVVCSPEAAKSEWVEREIIEFQEMGRSANVIAIVVSGEPFTASRGLPATLECLPPSLRQNEPLWLDWRDGKNQRKTFLRLVAALLSLSSFDELVRRDRARKIRQLAASISMALLVTIAGSGAAWRIAQLASDGAAARALTIAEGARKLLSDDDIEGAARLMVVAHTTDRRINFDADFHDVLNALKRLHPPLNAHGDDTTALYFVPDENALLEADGSGNVFAWNLSDGTSSPVAKIPQQNVLAFGKAASKESTVLFGGSDGVVGIIDLGATPLQATLIDNLGQPVLTFTSFEGEDYVVGSAGQVSRVRNSDGDWALEPIIQLTKGKFLAASISTEGDLIAVSMQGEYRDRAMSIHRWPLASLGPETLLPAREHSNDLACASVSRSSSLIVTGSCDGILQIWDSTTGRQIGQPLVGHRGTVELVRLSPNETLIASAGSDGTVRYWMVSGGSMYTGLLRPVLRGHSKAIRTIAFSESGEQLASASDDGTIRIWDMRPALFELDTFWDSFRGDPQTELPAPPPSAGTQLVEPVSSADGSTRVSQSRAGVLEIFEANGRERTEIAIGDARVLGLEVSTGGNKVGVRHFDNSTSIWTRDNNWRERVSVHHEAMGAQAISDARPFLAVATGRGRVSVIDYARNVEIERFTGSTMDGPYNANIRALQFDDARNQLVATTDDGTTTWQLSPSAGMSGMALVVEVCRVVLPGALSTITQADAQSEPALNSLVGVDACRMVERTY